MFVLEPIVEPCCRGLDPLGSVATIRKTLCQLGVLGESCIMQRYYGFEPHPLLSDVKGVVQSVRRGMEDLA